MEPWSVAMQRALYGPAGFYRRELPRHHFRTSVNASPLLAEAVQVLIERVSAQLSGELAVVDVGAGGGELLTTLATAAPASWRLVGVELRPRPAALPARVEWTAECEPGIRGVLIAHELLDNIPVDVVARVGGAWHQVLVDATGAESTGAVATHDEQDWLARWWPSPVDGDRVEVGLTRDRVWADLVSRLDLGMAVAVDYALDPSTMRGGTLTAYSRGRPVEPIPDGSCDLTAHVHFDAIASAGEAAGLRATRQLSQRDLLAEVGIRAARPPYSQAESDPIGYLRSLSRVGELSELSEAAGLGDFRWLLQTRGIETGLSAEATR